MRVNGFSITQNYLPGLSNKTWAGFPIFGSRVNV